MKSGYSTVGALLCTKSVYIILLEATGLYECVLFHTFLKHRDHYTAVPMQCCNYYVHVHFVHEHFICMHTYTCTYTTTHLTVTA